MVLDAQDFAFRIDALMSTQTILPIDELVNLSSSDRLPSGELCALTFDDGFVEHHRIVLPILKSRGIAATFFVNANCWSQSRTPRWLDLLYHLVHQAPPARFRSYLALNGFPTQSLNDLDAGADTLKQRLRRMESPERKIVLTRLQEALDVTLDEPSLSDGLYMNQYMLADLIAAGMTIGAHTLTHPDLGQLMTSDAEREIRESVAIVAELTSRAEVPFAYPYGGAESFSPAIRQMVADAGCPYACTSIGGMNSAATPRLQLRRIAAMPRPTLKA